MYYDIIAHERLCNVYECVCLFDKDFYKFCWFERAKVHLVAYSGIFVQLVPLNSQIKRPFSRTVATETIYVLLSFI